MQRSSRALSRLTAVITAVGLTVAGLTVAAVVAPVAAADPGPVTQRSADMVTADALPTVQIDGVVWSQAIIGNTVYAGGSFTTARPPARPPGRTPRRGTTCSPTTSPPAAHLLCAQSERPGARRCRFTRRHPAVRRSVISPPSTGHPEPGRGLDTATGALTDVNINIATRVKAIVATNSTVYVGGSSPQRMGSRGIGWPRSTPPTAGCSPGTRARTTTSTPWC